MIYVSMAFKLQREEWFFGMVCCMDIDLYIVYTEWDTLILCIRILSLCLLVRIMHAGLW